MADGKAPTTALWAARYRIIADQQRTWRTNCAEFESLYEQTWRVEGIPTNIQVTIPSTARAIVDESTDHSDCLLRHQIDHDTIDTDGVYHDVKVAWRALAQLQTRLEKFDAELQQKRQAQRDKARDK